jgi:hypothetical protein
MADSEIREQEYHCEDCDFLDDDPVPSECQKGYGQVAYLHRICEKFKLQSKTEQLKELHSKDE